MYLFLHVDTNDSNNDECNDKKFNVLQGLNKNTSLTSEMSELYQLNRDIPCDQINMVDETNVGANIVLSRSPLNINVQPSEKMEDEIIASNTSLQGAIKTPSFLGTDNMPLQTKEYYSGGLRATSTPIKLNNIRNLEIDPLEYAGCDEDIALTNCSMQVPLINLINVEMVHALVNVNGKIQVCAVPKEFILQRNSRNEKDVTNNSVTSNRNHEDIFRVLDVDSRGNVIAEPIEQGKLISHQELNERKIENADKYPAELKPNMTEQIFEVPSSGFAYVYSAETDKLTKAHLDNFHGNKDIGTYVPIDAKLKIRQQINAVKMDSKKIALSAKKRKTFNKKKIKQCYAIVRNEELRRKHNSMFARKSDDKICQPIMKKKKRITTCSKVGKCQKCDSKCKTTITSTRTHCQKNNNKG